MPALTPSGTTLAAALLTAALAAGCGNERTPPPDVVTPVAPEGKVPGVFNAAGVRFSAPSNWRVTAGRAPLVASVSSGRATVAIWRYPRTEPLPQGEAELERARRALIASSRARDRSLRVRSSRVVRRAGAPGVELRARGKVGGGLREIRSLHLYDRGAEIVVDAFAPARHFALLDRRVLAPLLASLRLRKPADAEREERG